MVNYYAGTSGMVLPVPNKSYYPPEYKNSTRLGYYGSLFNSVEVNSSFYKIPQAKTVAKWAAEVPAHFKFTFKLWREITHTKSLAFNPNDVLRFMQAIHPAGEKKGCLLVQLPPGAHANLLPQLRQLVNCIRDADPLKDWKIALEFRHVSWYCEALNEFAVSNDLSIVLQDIPTSATPFNFAGNHTVYLRFHGPGGKYRGSYPEEILQEYSTYIHEWQVEEKAIYAYFNNTMGDAVKNLAMLNIFVKQSGS